MTPFLSNASIISARHTRAVPAEWRGLTECAGGLIPVHMPPEARPKRRHLYSLLRHMQMLDTEPLEANFYYGLGEVMCGMARYLRREEVRGRVISNAAEGMVKLALLRYRETIPLDKPFVPTMGDLIQQFMEQPFFRVAEASWQAMPAPRRALVDVLTTTVIRRRHEVHGKLKMPRLLANMMSVEAARDLRPAAYQIARNSLAGATSVLGILLTGTNLDENTPGEVLTRPVPLLAVERARYSKSFIGAAQLRDDEFMGGAGWRCDDRGLMQFDTSILATPPQPLKSVSNPQHAHEGRLTCPAVQAGGLAHHVSRHILPDIIIAASHIVPKDLYGAK